MPCAERGDAARPVIVALTTTLPVRAGDGTPPFVLSLAQRLTDWFDVLVIAPRVPGAPPASRDGALRVQRFGYFLTRWEGLATDAILPTLRTQRWRIVEVPFLIVSMLVAGWRAIRRRRPVAVHAHWIVPAGLVAWLLHIATGVPYVLTVHGTDVYGLRMTWYKHLRDRIVSSAFSVMPVSDHLARALDLDGRQIRHEIVPMGTDFVPTDSMVRDPRHFLFVGRLADQKGVDVLLQAASMIESARVTIVGAGPESGRLHRLKDELELGDRVQFTGQLTQKDVLRLMQSAGALVIPSRQSRSGDLEGTPVVLAEGVATRTPIIASAVGGLSEQLTGGKTGVLVDPGSPGSLAAAMRQAMVDPTAMQQMAEMAFIKVMPSLDIRRTAERYAQVFASLQRSD